MAAEAVTANNVVPSSLARYVENTDGSKTISAVAFTGGQIAYKLVAGTYGVASTTGADPIHKPVGIFVNSGGAGQPCTIVYYDPGLAIAGATFDAGFSYVLGLTGAINPASDATTGWLVSNIATGLTATTLCFYCPMGAPTPLTIPTPAHA